MVHRKIDAVIDGLGWKCEEKSSSIIVCDAAKAHRIGKVE
ncbi:hypothetical protein HNQ54_003544 [Anaerocolumna cellulosilytica]|nr:hypothetical protein [Anaerocolumna cellulosilytica]